QDAIHVLARLALTGEKAPPSAAKIVEMWQPWLEARLKTESLADLRPLIDDQKAYAAMARKILAAMEMDAGAETPQENDSSEDGDQDEQESPESQNQD